MYLTVEHAENIEDARKIDLSRLMELDVCLDEDVLQTLIVIEVARWALELGTSFDGVYPMYIHDDNDIELDAGSSDNPDWIKEVAQFAWFVEQGSDSWVDSDQIFAVVDGVGWKWVDFDNLDDAVTDEYRSEFDGDYEEYAKEWMSEIDDGLPDHLEPYFDYEAYGEAMVQELNEYKWNGRTFLYHS